MRKIVLAFLSFMPKSLRSHIIFEMQSSIGRMITGRLNLDTTKKNYIPRCKECSKTYADNYIKSIKTKGLTRNQKKLSIMAKAVNGTLYVIGPDIPNTPYKIGITSGYDTSKRKTAIQTNHWMEMKIIIMFFIN